MSLFTKKFTAVADTNTKVWPPSAAEGFTHVRVRLATSAVGFVAKSSAVLTAGDGFPLFANDAAEDEIELVPGEELWINITAGGTVQLLVTPA